MSHDAPGEPALRVLHCRSSVGRFGPERVISELVPALRAQGVESRLLALYRPRPGGPAVHPWIAESRACGLEADQVLDPGALSMRTVRRLAGRIREADADVLHTHDYRTNVLGGLVARRADRAMPWVATVHLHTAGTRRLRLYRALDLFLLRLADRVVTVSRDQRRLLLSRGVDRRRLDLVPPAVDTSTFARQAGSPIATRARLGVAANAPLVVLAGRLTAQKGIDVFLAAARRLHDDRPEVRFVVVGNGPERMALEMRSRQLGLSEVAQFLGYQSDVASVLGAATVVALPSRAEGLPVVLLESLALSRPVVATSVGGVPDLVRDGETGLLVPPGDAEALAAAVRRCLDDPDLAHRLGAAGCQHVARHCSPSVAARRLARIYREVIAERG